MSELLMSQLAVTNMVYMHFSFDYFLDSCDRLGIHQLELYGCSHHFHFYNQKENVRDRRDIKCIRKKFYL